MAYCLVQDVANEFKTSPIGGMVSNEDMQSYIDQESDVIDSKVAYKYVTPVTGSNLLKKICIDMAAYRAAKVMNILGELSPVEDIAPFNQKNQYVAAYQLALQWLDEISVGQRTVPGGTLSTPSSIMYGKGTWEGDLNPDIKKW